MKASRGDFSLKKPYTLWYSELVHSVIPFIETTAFGVNNSLADMKHNIDLLLEKVHW